MHASLSASSFAPMSYCVVRYRRRVYTADGRRRYLSLIAPASSSRLLKCMRTGIPRSSKRDLDHRRGDAMKPILAVAMFVMLLITDAAHAAADDAKFYPPQEWTVAKQPNGSVEVQPPGVPAGETCGVMLLPDAEG